MILIRPLGSISCLIDTCVDYCDRNTRWAFWCIMAYSELYSFSYREGNGTKRFRKRSCSINERIELDWLHVFSIPIYDKELRDFAEVFPNACHASMLKCLHQWSYILILNNVSTNTYPHWYIKITGLTIRSPTMLRKQNGLSKMSVLQGKPMSALIR